VSIAMHEFSGFNKGSRNLHWISKSPLYRQKRVNLIQYNIN